MRTLKFKDETQEFYNILYEGLASTQSKGAETRILGKVFIKLEEHGKVLDKVPLYRLEANEEATVILEDAEYDLVKRLLDTVEWSGLGARKAGRLMLWLDAIPAETLKVEK
jgi:hypothetical protein